MSKAIMMAVGLALAGSALAQGSVSTDQATSEDLKQVALLRSMMEIPTIADQHPDVYYRNLGIEAYQDGDKQRALQMLLKSSSYADKLSQAMVAMMYWNGEGTPVDRPRAYAWMDLAADRGYHDLLVQRERYWSQLSEAERKQALDVGRGVYDEYGDKRSLDRLQQKLSAVAARVTGSHAGFQGDGNTLFESGINNGRRMDPNRSFQSIMEGSSGTVVDNSQRYASQVWDAKQYARLKDIEWTLATGHVEVGDLQVVHPAGTSNASASH